MTNTARLPGAFDHHWNWQLRAACRDLDTSLFFHPPGERGESHDDRDEAAKRVCARCPVLQLCRHYALAAHERYGVWGGLTEDERQAVFRNSARTRSTHGRRRDRNRESTP